MNKVKWRENIVTENVHPPIPIRRFDWSAWLDGEEGTSDCGWGETEQEAIDDLLQMLESYD